VIPVLPVLLGAKSLVAPAFAAAGMISLVSLILAFLSGMEVRKRVAMNVVIMTAAVAITYGIGVLTKNLWGVAP
jgi:VIT1/CCC1 family predicted Fe2+/Mn2+ transporter